jgi:hypothetical protein
MTDKRRLATEKFAKEVAGKADSYGGGALVQSLLNYLKNYGADMVELEKENIKTAFDAGVFIGMNLEKFPEVPASTYLKDAYDLD